MHARVGRKALDRYFITGILASGGQAVVYSGEDLRTAEKVAVKVARTRGLDGKGGERLELEAKVLAAVRSRFVARFKAAGHDPQMGCFCLVEELVPGVSLAMLMDRTEQLTLEEILGILEQVAEGLEALHRTGHIMRDLTPGQVMVDGSGGHVRAKLIDLGLSRSLSEPSDLTDPFHMAGTPGYTAPELATAKPIGPSADTYSLAALAYEMLGGAPPFPTVAPEAILALQLSNSFSPLQGGRMVREGRLGRVERVLFGALQAEPEARPGKPGRFVADLQAALGARRKGGWLGRWFRR